MDRIIKTYGKIVRLRPSGFWLGFIVGSVYFSYIFWWFWSLYPLDVLGVENNFYAATALFFVFSVSVISMAFFWGIFSFVSLRILKNGNHLLTTPAIAGLFVILEYLRSWGFGIIWWGSGSLIGPHWTLGNLAYLFGFSKYVLGTASVWGIYGINFFIVFILVSVLIILKKRSRSNLAQLLIAVIIFSLVGFFSKESKDLATQESLKVTLIQTERQTKVAYHPEELLSDFKSQLELLGSAAKEGSVIVFPETSNFSKTLSGFLDLNSTQAFFNKLSSKPLIILDNIRSPEKDGSVSRTIFINSKNGVVQFSDKQLLTPGGEYLPYIIKWPLWLLNGSVVNSFTSSQEFSKGSHTENLYFQGGTARIVICSEILSPTLLRDADYQFIIGQSSFGIFKGSKLLEYQILQALRFRAAENRKPAVLASNFGHSYIIDNNGNIVKSTDSSGYQILTADVVPNKEQTWYNKLGDLPILLLSLAIFGLSLRKILYAKQD